MSADSVRAAEKEELTEMLAAVEPAEPKPLVELLDRLSSRGRLKGVLFGDGAANDGTLSAREPDEPRVSGIAYDSRAVRPGSLFVAVYGVHTDGHTFVTAAAERGAVAAIVERPVPPCGLAQIVVDDSRLALATAAAWWYGDPSRRLGVVGVTGTDGKTTTAFLATAVLQAAGISTGLITTAALKVGGIQIANPEHVTTPQAPELQRLLAAMVRAGNEAAVVETTSHGLALGRVAEIDYDVAIFTNLTHEHLELHGTFEAYREAKLGLFRALGADRTPAAPDRTPAAPLERAPARAMAGDEDGNLSRPAYLDRVWPRTAIVNHDDASAAAFEAATTAAGARLLTYGLSAETAVRATAVTEDARHLRFEARTPRWCGEVTLQLAGRFNVSNALAAIALGEALELPPSSIRDGLAGVNGVPGRMERIDLGQPFAVIVDYAHSPASLRIVLEQLAPLATGRGGLIAVFGSAGERDVQKRPLMGRVAGELCRLLVVTDEDPRGEDRHAILDQIAAGALSAGKRTGEDLLCIADREEAIAAAFERARPGDVVLLAGKGHEQSIIMGDGPRAWDERKEAIAALQRLGYRGA